MSNDDQQPVSGPEGADRPSSRSRMGAHSGSSRIQRFSQAYGWRAYAIPVLVLATFFALVGVVRNVNAESSDGKVALAASTASTNATQAAAPTSSAASSTAAPASSIVPTPDGEALDPSAAPITDYVETGNGKLAVVGSKSGILGTGGPMKRFAVEIEGGLKVDGVAFTKAVEQILGDPRSWGAGGKMRFQRVSSGQIDFRVALVSPAHVESLCPGYGTGGYTSCRYQDRAVINLARWSVGVPQYEGQLATYREMVVNHEVGHWLGNGHASCPGPGKLAPVMQQQTLSLQGCKINAWPYPNSPADNPVNPNP